VDQINISIDQVSSLISESGQFTIIEWLLTQNILPYHIYENWRHEKLGPLESGLETKSEILAALISDVDKLCQKLNLIPESTEYFSWNEGSEVLPLSGSVSLSRALSLVWKRESDIPQLDLFMDNSAVICENQLHTELAAKSFDKAQLSLEKLSTLNNKNTKLRAYQDLINYGSYISENPSVEPDNLLAEFNGLADEVTPLAKESLKNLSRDYLALSWKRLAASAEHSDQWTQNWQLHPAYLLSQIPDWNGVRDALVGEASIDRHPELLQLLANALYFCGHPQFSLILWGQVAERFPDFCDDAIGFHHHTKPHLALTQSWDNFSEFSDEWPNTWFLGFLFIQFPGLVHLVKHLPDRTEGTITEPANQTTMDLVKAQIQEQDQKQLRKSLKESAPGLLNCFMNKRNWTKSS